MELLRVNKNFTSVNHETTNELDEKKYDSYASRVRDDEYLVGQYRLI